MRKNKGYTLIEMIIVIAIMAILSGMTFITMSIIKRARCEAATSALNNQIGALAVKTGAISKSDFPADLTSVEKTDYPLCMALVKTNQAFDVDNIHYRKDGYILVLGYLVGGNGGTFKIKESNKVEASITRDVIIDYVPESSGQQASYVLDATDPILGKCDPVSLIQIKKSTGAVTYGAGEYSIKMTGNNRLFSTVCLDEATGNHYSK